MNKNDLKQIITNDKLKQVEKKLEEYSKEIFNNILKMNSKFNLYRYWKNYFIGFYKRINKYLL